MRRSVGIRIVILFFVVLCVMPLFSAGAPSSAVIRKLVIEEYVFPRLKTFRRELRQLQKEYKADVRRMYERYEKRVENSGYAEETNDIFFIVDCYFSSDAACRKAVIAQFEKHVFSTREFREEQRMLQSRLLRKVRFKTAVLHRDIGNMVDSVSTLRQRSLPFAGVETADGEATMEQQSIQIFDDNAVKTLMDEIVLWVGTEVVLTAVATLFGVTGGGVLAVIWAGVTTVEMSADSFVLSPQREEVIRDNATEMIHALKKHDLNDPDGMVKKMNRQMDNRYNNLKKKIRDAFDVNTTEIGQNRRGKL